MSDLKTIRNVHNIRCGTHEWMVTGPLTRFAPQLVIVHAFDGCGVSIPADEIDLLIDALTTIRDEMKEADHE